MADNPARPRPPPNRRRDKVQLSCDPCRTRKLRCDRLRPCSGCSRRGIFSSCKYATAPPPTPNTTAQSQPTNLQGRITELESLVVSLMNGQSLPTPSASPSSLPGIRPSKQAREDASPSDPGTLDMRESGTNYVQSVHWEAILTKISGLKEDMVANNKALPGSQLFYGPNRHATRDEILAALPARSIVDRLMVIHFENHFITPYLIHSKRFLREYESFWQNPSLSSIAWIGLMYSMLFIAAQLQFLTTSTADERSESLKADYLSMKDEFRQRAIQCLILARYTKGGPYILETLITILTGEFLLVKDGSTDGWLSISMILHIAIRMGYHRDPDHFPSISPFEAEIRRRIWTAILQLDLTLSLETGLPRSATDTQIDTKLPRNLLESDFDEDTTEMPSPRPETEWSPILPLITRGRLISALGPICDINTDINPPSYDQVLKADALLAHVHRDAIPPIFRWQTSTITDSPNVVLQRVSAETTYYKARILLHRRALISYQAKQQAVEHDRNSMRICLDSALKIISFQQMLHEESSQPFGRLANMGWKVTHILNQDVLLATSVLCLYLQEADKFELSAERVEEVRQQLATSYEIWLQRSATSVEAGKVARALNVVLGRAEGTGNNGGNGEQDFLADLDAMELFNDQCFPPGFYSPLTFFDNVLEARRP